MDAEAEFREALGDIRLPRLRLAELTALLQTAQRTCAALEAHMTAATLANSLDAALGHAGHAVIAAEGASHALQAAARLLSNTRVASLAAELGARLALGKVMAGTGTLVYPLEHHMMEAAPGTDRVEITDAAKLPATLWRDKEPEPDKVEIGRALKLGPVPGARLARGPQSVRISLRKP